MTNPPRASVAERPFVLPPDRPEERTVDTQEQKLLLLALIEKHIVEGNKHIETMRQLISDGVRQRRDMDEAKHRLGQFLITQAHREAQREQVLREIDLLA